VRRLAVLAAEAGVEIREHSRVESLDDVDAGRVLVATDGYPSGLLGQIEGLIVPTRGQMIATEPLPGRIFDCPHYGRHGFDYWQQTPDGRVLAGGFRDWALDSEFTAVEETTAQIDVEVDGKKPATKSIDKLAQGENKVEPIKLESQLPPGQLRGVVHSLPAGKAVGKAVVTVTPGDKKIETAGDGTFSIDLAPGVYKISVKAAGFATQELDVTIDANGVTIKNIDLHK